MMSQILKRDFAPLGYGVILVFAIWLATAGIVNQNYEQEIREINLNNDQLTRSLEEHVRSSLIAADAKLLLIKSEYERAGYTPAVGTAMQSVLPNPLLLQSLIINAEGKVVHSTYHGAIATNYADRCYFQFHQQNGRQELYISAPMLGRITGKNSIYLSRRLETPGGGFAGVVALAVDPEYFSRFYRSMELQTGRLVRVVGEDGNVRASWNGRNNELGQDVADGFMFKAMGQRRSGHYQSPGIHYGVDRFFSYRAMNDFPLIVQVGYETEYALAEYRGRRNTFLWIAVFGSLLVVFFSIMEYRRQIARQLANQALQASEQRYRALMMQGYDAVALIDIEKLEVVEANPAFERLTGYKFPLEKALHVFELFADEQINILRYLAEVHTNGVLPPNLRKIRTLSGGSREVERTGTLIEIDGRSYQLTTFRDVTQERVKQRELHNELLLAAQVQRALLPEIPRSHFFDIAAVFKPKGFVSGDLYYLEWQESCQVLRGFLLDITGHGMATALQTAAVNVLLRELMDLPQPLDLSGQLDWLNRRIPRYVDESTFVAAIGFELDFTQSELRYAAAGINQFLLNAERVLAPGLYLGICETEAYELRRVAMKTGDSICFLTDGISDIFDATDLWAEMRAEQVCRLFHESEIASQAKDDATAICITIKRAQ